MDSIPASVIKDALAASTSRHGALRIPSSVARSLGLMPKAAPQARVGAVDPQTLLTQALRARLGDDAVLSEVRNLIPGRRYRADIVIPDRRLVIEFDGFQYHRSKAAFQKDRERQNLFVAHGWRVLRFFNKQVRDDLDGVVEQIVSLAVSGEAMNKHLKESEQAWSDYAAALYAMLPRHEADKLLRCMRPMHERFWKAREAAAQRRARRSVRHY